VIGMYVIRLPNGNLLVPESALSPGGVMGDAYVEVTPADPDYSRLASQAVPEAEFHARRQRWREGDEALRREFERYRAGQEGGQGSPAPGEGAGAAGLPS
jgi:hypothetical protein